MRVLVATDAWRPQVNGVVRTYERLEREVAALGAELVFLSTSDFKSVPCPTYPEVRLALPHQARADQIIKALEPDAIHIATEGPVGWMARRHCLRVRRPFTTSFHTRFAEYIASRSIIPADFVYAILRRFHRPSAGVMVATDSLFSDLKSRGFQRLVPWTRGVDTELFKPRPERRFGSELVFLYVGRVAVEKNVEAFLRLDLPGRKVVVGDGPALAALRQRFPETTFTGALAGEELAIAYSSADVFVFPSRTDTFGLVLLEAMASGVPVAAFPVTGPRDVVAPGISGILSEDLKSAACEALKLDTQRVRARAREFDWGHAARLFLMHVSNALGAEAAQGVRATKLGRQRKPQFSQ